MAVLVVAPALTRGGGTPATTAPPAAVSTSTSTAVKTSTSTTTTQPATTTTTTQAPAPATSSTTSAPAVPSAPALSPQQELAVQSAESYLRYTAFSRAGLIRQLSSSAGEGYSVADATAAVDSLNVDWNGEAVRSAESYLKYSAFSCSGLQRQLSSSSGEGFTKEQAAYGAKKTKACA